MTHAIVLIEAERDALATLGGRLAELEGVGAAYSVTGDWDFVAVLKLRRHEELADVIPGGLNKVPGVTHTETHIAFRTYSRHDLDAAFSLGLGTEA